MALRDQWEQGAHLGSKVPDMFADLMALRGRWEQGAHLGNKVLDMFGQPTLWPFEADREQGAHLRSKPTLWSFEADREQGVHLGSKVPDMFGQPTLWPFEADREQGAHLGSKVPDMFGQPTLWSFEADGREYYKINVNDARHNASRAPPVQQKDTLLFPFASRSLRRSRLGVRLGAGVSDLAGKQRQHLWKVGILEAFGQSRVDLFLHGPAAGGESPLPVDPHELVPDLSVDEGRQELFGNGFIGADEPSNAVGIFHLLNCLLLGLLRLLSSAFNIGEVLLRFGGSVLGSAKLFLKLPDSDLGRGDMFLERLDLLLSDTLQGPSPTEEFGCGVGQLKRREVRYPVVARLSHDGLHARHLVPYLVDGGGGQRVPLVQALLQLERSAARRALRALEGENLLDLRLLPFFFPAPALAMHDVESVDLVDFGASEQTFLLLNDLAVQEEHFLPVVAGSSPADSTSVRSSINELALAGAGNADSRVYEKEVYVRVNEGDAGVHHRDRGSLWRRVAMKREKGRNPQIQNEVLTSRVEPEKRERGVEGERESTGSSSRCAAEEDEHVVIRGAQGGKVDEKEVYVRVNEGDAGVYHRDRGQFMEKGGDGTERRSESTGTHPYSPWMIATRRQRRERRQQGRPAGQGHPVDAAAQGLIGGH
nr:hypothetical protein Iba_chr12dCG10080 [Ipomoea batatas]